jgi:glutathione S-transferase
LERERACNHNCHSSKESFMLDNTVTLFHSPQSRSSCALMFLEELAAPYQLHVLNMKMGEQRHADYLAVNPLGKVPAIRHHGAVVTEQVAIFIYLADAFPKMALAPAIDSPLRGPYLRWMVYYAACFEPGIMDRALKRDPAPRVSSPYGDFDSMLANITEAIGKSPYLVGDHLSAADLLWGNGLRLGTMFKLLPENSIINEYVMRITSRPSFTKVAEIDGKLAAEHAEAAKAAG